MKTHTTPCPQPNLSRPRSRFKNPLKLPNNQKFLLLKSPDFLRLSRATVDDTISQNLNALVKPSSAGFNPSSTSSDATTTRTTPSHRRVSKSTCEEFKERVLLPSWQGRSDVLNYCAGVATSPDPDDPEHVLREVENARARERVVDERLDPYSGRYFPTEGRTEALANLIRSERTVERIVRERTWRVVEERCESDGGGDSEEALNQWRRRHEELTR